MNHKFMKKNEEAKICGENSNPVVYGEKRKKCLILAIMMVFISPYGQSEAFGQLRINTHGNIFYGTESYSYLGWGDGASDKSQWALEHWTSPAGVSGVNLWRPWPNVNAGNYFLFVEDQTGTVSMGGEPSGLYSDTRLEVFGSLVVHGAIRYTGGIALFTPSGKGTERPVDGALEKLLSLQPLSFQQERGNWRQVGVPNDNPLPEKANSPMRAVFTPNGRMREMYGFQPAAVAQVLPELVSESQDGGQGVDLVGMVPLLVQAIKEQELQIELLRRQVAEIEAEASKMGTLSSISDSGQETGVITAVNPNPFQGRTDVHFNLRQDGSSAQIVLCDLTGKLVKTIDVARGSSSAPLDATGLPSGAYLCFLVVDGRATDSEKIILNP